MAEFVVKLNNDLKELDFISKLNINFNTLNSKNLLLNRKLEIFSNEKNIYSLVNVTPLIPNVPFYVGIGALFIYVLISAFFLKHVNSLLIIAGIMFILSFCWTKYFFYFMLKRSMKKYGILKMELL